MWSGALLRAILFALAASAAFGAAIVDHDFTIDGSLYTYAYQLTNAEPSRAIIDFQLTISGSHTQILAPNSDWLTAPFAAGSGTGIKWITMGSGIQPGGALSGFRVIFSDAAGPAAFRVDFDDFTSLPSPGSAYYTLGQSGVPEPARATLVGLGLPGLLAARIRLRRRGEA